MSSSGFKEMRQSCPTLIPNPHNLANSLGRMSNALARCQPFCFAKVSSNRVLTRLASRKLLISLQPTLHQQPLRQFITIINFIAALLECQDVFNHEYLNM